MESKHALWLLPLLALASDFYCIVLSPPPPSPARHDHHSHHHPRQQATKVPLTQPPPTFSRRDGTHDRESLGGKFHISFCSSCSYKKTAVEARNMLVNAFPGTDVILTNHPPPFLKQVLIKLMPIVQFTGIGLVVGGDHIFPRLGYASPPSWYDSLRRNRFGAAASFWLIGNVLQNTLQSTGAFEVYFDGDLIFSKLREKRFPEEFELRELVAKTLELKASKLM